jgi:hypothetical protein
VRLLEPEAVCQEVSISDRTLKFDKKIRGQGTLEFAYDIAERERKGSRETFFHTRTRDEVTPGQIGGGLADAQSAMQALAVIVRKAKPGIQLADEVIRWWALPRAPFGHAPTMYLDSLRDFQRIVKLVSY